jgi:hypothetical protein
MKGGTADEPRPARETNETSRERDEPQENQTSSKGDKEIEKVLLRREYAKPFLWPVYLCRY